MTALGREGRRTTSGAPWKFRPELHSQEARRNAAVVLEVLAGACTPAEAAAALAVSQPRYFALEARALEGLVAACERRAHGPRQGPERQIARLKRETSRLQREGARTAALLRIAQRALGLRAIEQKRPAKDAAGRRRRKPSVRALRAARALRSPPAVESVTTGGDNGATS